MFFAKQLIDHYIRRGVKSKKDKKSLARSARGLRRNSRSMLSMDNLDVDESGSDSGESGASGSGGVQRVGGCGFSIAALRLPQRTDRSPDLLQLCGRQLDAARRRRPAVRFREVVARLGFLYTCQIGVF